MHVDVDICVYEKKKRNRVIHVPVNCEIFPADVQCLQQTSKNSICQNGLG